MTPYRVLIAISVDARDYREAHEFALKLDELLKSPLARAMIESQAGIRLLGDGRPVVHQPQREDPAAENRPAWTNLG